MNKYYILDTLSGNILHESHTDFNPVDKEQLKHLLVNTFWTPLSIVHKYLSDPESITIILVSEYEQPKPKRKRKSKTQDKQGG